jgi:predicted SAM-dependent methyltransferase
MKLHVGCGKRFIPGWIHVDGEFYPHIHKDDVFLWDCETESAEVLYSSHLLEYFDKRQGRILLTQWHRVLRPGGILRLAVPDFEAMARLYISDPVKYPLDSFIGPLYGRMRLKDEFIFHKNCYDFISIKTLLLSIGFKSVYRYDWRKTEHSEVDDHSHAHVPHDPKAIRTGNFTDTHTLISLNVEAIK